MTSLAASTIMSMSKLVERLPSDFNSSRNDHRTFNPWFVSIIVYIDITSTVASLAFFGSLPLTFKLSSLIFKILLSLIYVDINGKSFFNL